jgi:hypothetical protein
VGHAKDWPLGVNSFSSRATEKLTKSFLLNLDHRRFGCGRIVGSNVAESTVAVSVIGVPEGRRTSKTTVSLTVSPEARLGTMQVTLGTLPGVPPCAGAAQDPLLMVALMKVPAGTQTRHVASAGKESSLLTSIAVLGPVLVTTMVYVSVEPLCTESGALLVIVSSAIAVDREAHGKETSKELGCHRQRAAGADFAPFLSN